MVRNDNEIRLAALRNVRGGDSPVHTVDATDTLPNENLDDLGDVAVYADGGYGWIVTASAFTLCFLYLGTLYSWGVMQAELAKSQIFSTIGLSTIGAITAFFLGICCLPATWILQRIGPRLTAIVGVVGAIISLLSSSFCTRNFAGLIFTQGIMFGATGSLVYLTAYTTPSQWFIRKRGIATGLASCGGGLGGAVLSIATERIIAAWGLAWTFRFLALLHLVLAFPAALLLKPGHLGTRTIMNGALEKGIFRSSRYIRLLAACFIASYPFFIPPYYISQYAQSIGLSASQGALYSALYNAASGVGRVAFGILADVFFGNINSWMLSILLITLSSLLVWPHALDETLIIIFVIVCGLGSGGFFSLQSSIVGQIIGSRRQNRGVGWVEVAESFGYLAGPISAGALLDAFGGADKGARPYQPAIYLVGGTTAISLVLVASIRFSSERRILRKV